MIFQKITAIANLTNFMGILASENLELVKNDPKLTPQI